MNFFRRIFLYLRYITVALFVLSWLQVLTYRWLPVSYTPLMCLRAWEHRHDAHRNIRYRWVALSDIAPKVPLAVMASEDNRFESHHGFDWEEIRKARTSEKRKRMRGASTITQQVAKNVFLWPQRSWLRKGLEAYYTVLIECCWSKRRIMEVYLNVVEMGEEIYGIEAAAQYYYKKPAKKLSAAEAAMIAACLPNPLKRHPTKPTPYLLRRQKAILALMHKIAQPKFLVAAKQ
jgi:monofunctional biosynthetic peptidoglycan transglycosylase